MGDTNNLGARPFGSGSRPSDRAPAGLAAPRFDPSRLWAKLSPALRKSFMQVPGPYYLTADELKPATAMGLTLLVTKHGLLDRRWATWGGELGQKSGCGYEYAMTPKGIALYGWVRDSDRNPEGQDLQGLGAEYESAGRATASPNPSQDTPHEE